MAFRFNNPDLSVYGRIDVNLNCGNDTFSFNAGIRNLPDKTCSDSASVGLNPLFINEVGFFTLPNATFFSHLDILTVNWKMRYHV